MRLEPGGDGVGVERLDLDGDVVDVAARPRRRPAGRPQLAVHVDQVDHRAAGVQVPEPERLVVLGDRAAEQVAERKSVVEGKRVSVRVDPGGRRIIKKKNKNNNTYTQFKTST